VEWTQLTDLPCPECGKLLDLVVQPPPPEVTDEPQAEDQRSTVKVPHFYVCPECSWIRKA
jgi:hypothetical protein